MKSVFLFTYGLLTNRSHIGYDVKFVGIGVLNNHTFELLTHANVMEYSTDIVHGLVWEITPEKLAYTDIIEAYPFYYDRVIEPITMSNGDIIECYVYKMTDESRERSLNCIPSYSYLDSLVEGYNELIPTEQLKKAMENAYKRII